MTTVTSSQSVPLGTKVTSEISGKSREGAPPLSSLEHCRVIIVPTGTQAEPRSHYKETGQPVTGVTIYTHSEITPCRATRLPYSLGQYSNVTQFKQSTAVPPCIHLRHAERHKFIVA